MPSKSSRFATHYSAAAFLLLITMCSPVWAASTDDDDDDDVSASATQATAWLNKIVGDAKLRNLYCTESSLKHEGMQLIMEGRTSDGHPLVMKGVALGNQVLKEYKINTSTLSSAVIDASNSVRKNSDKASLNLLTLYRKVHAACDADHLKK